MNFSLSSQFGMFERLLALENFKKKLVRDSFELHRKTNILQSADKEASLNGQGQNIALTQID